MIESAVCTSAKMDFLKGVHQPDDVYMIALYTEGANIGPQTRKYTPNGEVGGQGYTQGGVVMESIQYGQMAGAAYIGWNGTPQWPNATITVHGAMVYNATKGDKALAVFAFDAPITSTNGLFELLVPKDALVGIA